MLDCLDSSGSSGYRQLPYSHHSSGCSHPTSGHCYFVPYPFLSPRLSIAIRTGHIKPFWYIKVGILTAIVLLEATFMIDIGRASELHPSGDRNDTTEKGSFGLS